MFLNLPWWHRILLIPLTIFVYLFLIDFVSSNNIFSSSQGEGVDMGSVLQIGLGQAVGVSVMRPYFGGALMLPIYSGAIGDVGIYHNIFFNLIYLLTALVIISIIAEFFKVRIPFLNEVKVYKHPKQKKKGGR